MPPRIMLFMTNTKKRHSRPAPESPRLMQRRTEPHVSRLWLLAFILLSAMLTGGALMLRYRLEGVEGAVAAMAQARTGATLKFENADVAGIRSIRLDGIDITYPVANGPDSRAEIGSMYVQFDIVDLLQGQLTLESLRFQDAHITLNRPSGPIGTAARPAISGKGPSVPLQLGALNVEGVNCRLTVGNIRGDASIDLDDLNFSIRKPAASTSLTGEISARRDGKPKNEVYLSGFFESADRFAIRARMGNVTAEEINPYLSAPQRFVETGALDVEARVEALPDAPMSVWLSADIADLGVRNQPAALANYSGALSATMEYDPKSQRAENISARAESADWRGTVYGDINFAGETPAFNIDVDAAPLPLVMLFETFLLDRLTPYGELSLTPHPSSSLQVHIAGTAADPDIAARLRLAGAEAQFTSANPRWPSGDITFGPIEASWDSATGTPQGHATILRGSLRQEEFNVEIDDLAGIVDVHGTNISSETFSGRLTGQTFVGSVDYDVPTRKGTFTLNAGIAGLEDTPLHDRIKHTTLWGSGSIRATGTLAPDEYTADIAADASQTRVLYNWWLDKPAGLAVAGNVGLRFRPNKDLKLRIDANAAGSPVHAEFDIARVGSKWRLLRIAAQSPKGDIAQVARAVRLPYRFEGGFGQDIDYLWTRKFEGPNEWESQASGKYDRVVMTPDGGEHAFIFEEGTFDVQFTKGEQSTGKLILHAANAETPPLRGSTWFIDPRKDDPLLEEYPRGDRPWTFHITADEAHVPPWHGTAFSGEGYSERPSSGLRYFNANVDEGRIQGWFEHHSVENLTQLTAEWNKIPSQYLLDYLEFPHVLVGVNTGSVSYTVDSDDPSTATGTGSFTVSDGKFSADYLISLLEGSEGLGASMLPQSLAFKTLSTQVEIKGDQVNTPNLFLDSEGFELRGEGGFIVDGDMNYTINVAISPKVAEGIPPLREALNMQGLKITQQNVELGFNVKGPLFKPRGELSQLPTADVMLVTGALGVGTDLIDLPRQILADVFKVFAGTAMAN